MVWGKPNVNYPSPCGLNNNQHQLNRWDTAVYVYQQGTPIETTAVAEQTFYLLLANVSVIYITYHPHQCFNNESMSETKS